MPTDGLPARDRVGPFDLHLNQDLVWQFVAATGDPSSLLRKGRVVPPSLLATLAYRPQFAALMELVPERVLSAARSGVHGQHELHLHRRIASDDRLHTFIETDSVRPVGENLCVTLHHLILSEEELLVAEQWWTTVLLGTTAEPNGPHPPDHRFVRAPDSVLVAEEVVPVRDDMVRHYADVSGDHSEHHFTVEAARRSGFDAPILHGLCTMALCAGVACRTVAGGDPGGVRRVAVRFAAPAFIGQDLKVEIFERREGGFAMEAHCRGRPVITNGLVELWDRGPSERS